MPVFAGMVIGIALAGAPPPASEAPKAAFSPQTRAELAVFHSDLFLMNWALRFFDLNGDNTLAPSEAAAAADSFRKLADKNGDGRVTMAEYRAARRFIKRRY